MRNRLKISAIAVFSLLLVLIVSFASAAAADRVEKQYRLARSRYYSLLENHGQGGNRGEWLAVLRVFKKISQEHARHQKAPASLFLAGRVARSSYQRFRNPLDLGEAIISFKDLATLYPSNDLADDAMYLLAEIYRSEKGKPELAGRTLARIAVLYPQSDMAPRAIQTLREIKGKKPLVLESSARKVSVGRLATLRPVRYWSTAEYTRVVIETSAPVDYKSVLLEKGAGETRQLAVDLMGATISHPEQVAVDDGLLQLVRSEQLKNNTARVVLSTLPVADYKIFNLEDPFRVVVDISGHIDLIKIDSRKVFEGGAPTLAQQLGLGIRRIVLDPGHGGRDPGAVGLFGLIEKDLTLKIARKVAERLKKQWGFKVVLTREKDEFLALEERTAIANTSGGDLFVSIHVNASPDNKANGLETYFLDLASTEDAMRVAALENATSSRELSDLQDILLDLMQNAKMAESARLADILHKNMIKGLERHFSQVENLGVKRAPFIVLIGARMPAVLMEIGFLSNQREARLLQKDAYLDTIAMQVAEGISCYAQNLSLAEK